ncbi:MULTISPECIES: hypothetical protein [unclassified Rhizobium]|nr:MULTISPECIES: hypothetical protein [unclassified Rhizobium]
MTPRSVLFLMIAGFFAVALLLIHNAYYKPNTIDRASIPAVAEQS